MKVRARLDRWPYSCESVCAGAHARNHCLARAARAPAHAHCQVDVVIGCVAGRACARRGDSPWASSPWRALAAAPRRRRWPREPSERAQARGHKHTRTRVITQARGGKHTLGGSDSVAVRKAHANAPARAQRRTD
eukprot:6203812-Pleurochrysis_carterae.AAC.1